MTKTDLRKLRFEKTLELLTNFHGAFDFEDEMGGRLTFEVEKSGFTFSGEVDRDSQICLVDSIKLFGGGFSDDVIRKHEIASRLEDEMNKGCEEFSDSFLTDTFNK